MTQKLTEEQQRSAHKIIVANRGDYTKESIYLDCHNCPRIYECDGRAFNVFLTKNFQTDNLRRSQVWLDEHSATAQEPPKRRPTPDALRIIALERQVDDLTKKLDASKKLCERQQRRLRANWEAKRDGEMATREEIIAWFDAGKGAAIINGSASRIRLMSRTDWIPATRGNLKL